MSENYISPILCGGFGNNLYQVATAIHYSKTNNIPFIIGYWDSHNSRALLSKDHPSAWAGKPNPYFQPWGGWSGTDYPDFTWSNMFPNLPYQHELGETFNVDDKYAYEYDTGEAGEYIPLDFGPGTQFQGYFFNHKYWHESRYEILNYLRFDNNYIESNEFYLPHYLQAMTTVSLNFRLPDAFYAGDLELKDQLVEDLESLDWLKKAINYFPSTSLFVVTSNDPYKARQILREHFPNKFFYFIIGSPGAQMVASINCAHHILTSSTFSFWCCYLDPKQPMGHTVYSKNFLRRHSNYSIPFSQWRLLE